MTVCVNYLNYPFHFRAFLPLLLQSLARQLEITDQLPTVILLKNGGDEEEWFSGADNEELRILFQRFFP